MRPAGRVTYKWPKGLVSKETVVLRPWGVETNVWFIDSVADVSSIN